MGSESATSWPRRLVPGLVSLRGYQRGWLRGDVIAGITVTAYLVPQVMAYAQIAGLPAVTGLWAVFITLPLAASTLVTVPALARPEWKMEIALVAAR